MMAKEKMMAKKPKPKTEMVFRFHAVATGLTTLDIKAKSIVEAEEKAQKLVNKLLAKGELDFDIEVYPFRN
jgi:hypothetical protein